ncbi:VOC family protein [Saccharothrix xinjiangensis]|uniref:VOC family protein n=1 Tax=Saccharothrix xinjiangensis TaxID=204798 RepID=A0ABV9XVQ7_9PSEU
MILMPVVYVSDVDASVAFYAALGFVERNRSRSGAWVELDGPGGRLGLHESRARRAPALPEADEPVGPGVVMLGFVTTEPLEKLVEAVAQAGHEPVRGIADESFGRSVVLADPDGAHIQVNEHDEELYT